MHRNIRNTLETTTTPLPSFRAPSPPEGFLHATGFIESMILYSFTDAAPVFMNQVESIRPALDAS